MVESGASRESNTSEASAMATVPHVIVFKASFFVQTAKKTRVLNFENRKS
jgi:hypothetical protein